ncbi:uncharacterized protein JCM15063_005634 [Sporobolomyces koalae]|uniref:uncharacterized protein n=1 Tax=Sporobolomyces koalae TaxID=500713 RepID=UPI00317C0D85
MFKSGFSEGSTRISCADLPPLPGPIEHEQDEEDFREWLPSHEHHENEVGDDASTMPDSGGNDVDEPTVEADGSVNELAAATSAGQSGTAKSVIEDKPLREIVVVDSSYQTCRAFVYWLYTNEITFTEPASNYVVYVKSSSVDTCEPESRKRPLSAESQSRRDWLLEQTRKKRHHILSSEKVEPASAHAIYRLSDKLDVQELKILAKETIIAGLSTENVLYELCSSFSYHHTEIQDAALAYALAHWEKVKLVPAFKHVLSGPLGKIEGAPEILLKLMSKMKV